MPHIASPIRYTRIAVALATQLASSAMAYDATMVWSPVAAATGYTVHIGQNAPPSAAGIDVGSPSPDADGLIRHVVTGLPLDQVNSFAVTSRDSVGRESAFSNLISLSMPSTNPSAAPSPQPTASPGSTPVGTNGPPAGQPTPVTPATTDLIPGGGARPVDCVTEWVTAPVPLPGRDGLPTNRVDCTDDDPTCDYGSASGDHVCTFHVALCLNVNESRFPCVPTDVTRVLIRSPSRDNPLALGNRTALQQALVDAGGLARGLCANLGPNRGHLCATAGECDSATGRGDGVCRGQVASFEPPLAARDQCTAFANIAVPLRVVGTRFVASTQAFSLQATPSVNPVTGRLRASDLDTLILVCHPHP